MFCSCAHRTNRRGSRMRSLRSRTAFDSRARELEVEQVQRRVPPGVTRSGEKRVCGDRRARSGAGDDAYSCRVRASEVMRLGGCMCPQRYCLTGKSLVSLSFIVGVSREAQSADRPVALQPASGCLVARGLGSRAPERRHMDVRCGLDSSRGSPHVVVHVVAVARLVARSGREHAGGAAGPASRLRASARDPPGFGERMAAGGARYGVGGDFVGTF